jgi:dTDP-4-dehydrorhamnose reductase
VTGAGGQVGTALRELLPEGRFLDHEQFDIRDETGAHESLSGCTALIHLAAMTNVDSCEEQPEVALAINGQATGILARAAGEQRIPMIYVSTDYVFDGRKPTPYAEADEPNPINVYGRSKLKGERHVAEYDANLIVRTSWVFGRGRNFVRSILNAAGRGEPLTVVDDQTGRPTSAKDLAAAIVFALRSEQRGLLHVSGSGPSCTWAGLAEEAIKAAGMSVPITRTDSETYRRSVNRTVAVRPKNSVLALDKATALGVPLADWRRGLKAYVKASS